MSSDSLTIGNYLVKHALTLPIDSDPLKSRTDWQGATYAEDPRNGAGYLFQAQVNRTGPGDVEDIWVHVYQIKGGGASFAKPIYKFSCIIKRAGHVQTLHVRISIHGRMWAWMGCENYKNNKTAGTSLWRIRLRRGRVILGKSAECKKIITGPGSVNAIGCFDGAGKTNFTVVLRRPESKTELYEWYNEAELMRHTDKAKRPRVYAAMRIPREGGTFQSACADGNFKTANKNGAIYRINGSTGQRTTVRRFPKVGAVTKIMNKLRGQLKTGIWDITNYAPAAARPVSSEEGESVLRGPGRVLMAGKRANSSKRRKVFFCTIASKPVA